MKVKLIITKRKVVDIPDSQTAAFANAYFKRLGPEVYADLLCRQLDFNLKNMNPITHTQVGVSDFSAEMTISLVTLVEGLQGTVHELDILEPARGEKYEIYNDRDYSVIELSRILGQTVMRPTRAKAKALCSPIINVHGRHYQADIMPIVATTTIMTHNGNMIDPGEWFYYGKIEVKETWENLVNLILTYENSVIGMPLVFYGREEDEIVEGTLKDLLLDRCIFDQKITEAIGVDYYHLPEETGEELR